MRLGGSDFAGAVRLNLVYFTVQDSVAIRLDRESEAKEGNTVGELADFLALPLQCETEKREPKLFAKVGQHRKDGKGSSTTLQEVDLFASVTCS